jgi:hypothetical protein
MPASSYSQNVFINCPFDAQHASLLRAMTFAIHDCGFVARCAMESEDSGEIRMRRIVQIVRESQYSIHDISRIELDGRRDTRASTCRSSWESASVLANSATGSSG